MIRLNNIRKSYPIGKNRHLEVLKGIDMHIAKGEMVAIMGSSGSGKSTLLNVIGMLDNYDSGEYILDGTLIKDLSETKAAVYRNKFLGFVFQSFNLIPFKTAQENVALPLYYKGVSRSKRMRQALEYLDQVSLADWATHKPSELSGGQKQRVAIARALITEPRVILADEPTGALDSQTSSDIMALLKRIHAGGITMLIVTHEADIAAQTERIIRLRDGIIESPQAPIHV